MSRHVYVVFGAGRQGTAAIHDLVLHCEAQRVVVVEPDDDRRAGAKVRLAKLLGKRAKNLSFLAQAKDKDLAGAHVLLACTPYSVNLELTRLALRLKIPFCDLGGNPEVVAAQEKLAAKAATPIVPDCGISPGLSNVLAAHCARVHGCDVVRVRCGGLPLVRPDPKVNPLLYKLVFSPLGLISEYSGDVPVIRGGKVTSIGALSTIERFDDGHESSPTSNNSPQVVRYLASLGVREYDYATVRYDGHWQLVHGWKTLGFLCGNEGRDRVLATALENDALLRYHTKKDRDVLILRVTGSHSTNGLRRGFEYRLDVPSDTKTLFSAMELTTCWGITIVAHHMASGRGAPKGFATPERFVDSTWVIGEIERRLAGLSG